MKTTKKGQTALEYLLILVVTITVVVSVIIWLTVFSGNIEQRTNNTTSGIRCGTAECDHNADCEPYCGSNSECFEGLCRRI
jgi:uncharacterized protein (UPF0333 family)